MNQAKTFDELPAEVQHEYGLTAANKDEVLRIFNAGVRLANAANAAEIERLKQIANILATAFHAERSGRLGGKQLSDDEMQQIRALGDEAREKLSAYIAPPAESSHFCAKCGQRKQFKGDPPPPCKDCDGTLCEKCCDARMATPAPVASSACEHCGGTEVVHDCLQCGAPNCCPTCCKKNTEQMLKERESEGDTICQTCRHEHRAHRVGPAGNQWMGKCQLIGCCCPKFNPVRYKPSDESIESSAEPAATPAQSGDGWVDRAAKECADSIRSGPKTYADIILRHAPGQPETLSPTVASASDCKCASVGGHPMDMDDNGHHPLCHKFTSRPPVATIEPMRFQAADKVPMKPGYYWAKWKIPAKGTHEASDLCPMDDWEIVQVNENELRADPKDYESLSVSVCGVRECQWRDCFVWGDFVSELRKSATTDGKGK